MGPKALLLPPRKRRLTLETTFRRVVDERKDKGLEVGGWVGACEVLELAETCVAALVAVGRDVRPREEAVAPVRGAKQVEGWGKDVTSPNNRHDQDKLYRRGCVGGGILLCSRRERGGERQRSDESVAMKAAIFASSWRCCS
jgi:hypothetical protein